MSPAGSIKQLIIGHMPAQLIANDVPQDLMTIKVKDPHSLIVHSNIILKWRYIMNMNSEMLCAVGVIRIWHQLQQEARRCRRRRAQLRRRFAILLLQQVIITKLERCHYTVSYVKLNSGVLKCCTCKTLCKGQLFH